MLALLVSATLGTNVLLLPGLSGLKLLSLLDDFFLNIISSFSCLAAISALCCLWINNKKWRDNILNFYGLFLDGWWHLNKASKYTAHAESLIPKQTEKKKKKNKKKKKPPQKLEHSSTPCHIFLGLWWTISQGLKKNAFSWEYSHISHHILCISLCQKTKFPSKFSNFPRILLPDYPFPPPCYQSSWNHRTPTPPTTFQNQISESPVSVTYLAHSPLAFEAAVSWNKDPLCWKYLSYLSDPSIGKIRRNPPRLPSSYLIIVSAMEAFCSSYSSRLSETKMQINCKA